MSLVASDSASGFHAPIVYQNISGQRAAPKLHLPGIRASTPSSLSERSSSSSGDEVGLSSRPYYMRGRIAMAAPMEPIDQESFEEISFLSDGSSAQAGSSNNNGDVVALPPLALASKTAPPSFEADPPEDECVICLDEVDFSKPGKHLQCPQCKTVVHPKCLQRWFLTQNFHISTMPENGTCPICRAQFDWGDAVEFLRSEKKPYPPPPIAMNENEPSNVNRLSRALQGSPFLARASSSMPMGRADRSLQSQSQSQAQAPPQSQRGLRRLGPLQHRVADDAPGLLSQRLRNGGRAAQNNNSQARSNGNNSDPAMASQENNRRLPFLKAIFAKARGSDFSKLFQS